MKKEKTKILKTKLGVLKITKDYDEYRLEYKGHTGLIMFTTDRVDNSKRPEYIEWDEEEASEELDDLYQDIINEIYYVDFENIGQTNLILSAEDLEILKMIFGYLNPGDLDIIQESVDTTIENLRAKMDYLEERINKL